MVAEPGPVTMNWDGEGDTAETTRSVPPVLLSVTESGLLVVPMSCVPKSSVDGESVACAGLLEFGVECVPPQPIMKTMIEMLLVKARARTKLLLRNTALILNLTGIPLKTISLSGRTFILSIITD